MAIVFNYGDQKIDADEMVQLCAVDPDLFYHTFFPKTARQGSAPFHLKMDSMLENPVQPFNRYNMFRGSAKTTRLRMYTGRRVSYGISRTILYVGASEDHAVRSVRWLKTQVEKNTVWTKTFGLRAGSKWDQAQIEIVNDALGITSWILGVGITGNLRGINFDDYRPDLILLDDIITDENAATLEQREKISDLVFGALKESLAPKTEEPNAKMVFLQTPLHLDDAAMRAEKDPEWVTLTQGCWTDETKDAPVDEQISVWEERYPTVERRASKKAAAKANRLSKWLRENECRLVSPETTSFKSFWLNKVVEMPGRNAYNVLAIDPVPPPSDRELEKGLQGKDFEVLGVCGRAGHNYYVQEYVANRGHEPNWTIYEAFRLAIKYGVAKIVVESTAYQRTLKWLIEQEMRRRGLYFLVEEAKDKRKKFARITSTLSGIASHGQLYCHPEHVEFIEQFENYPEVDHDDVIDMVSMGMSELVDPILELMPSEYAVLSEPKLIMRRAAP